MGCFGRLVNLFARGAWMNHSQACPECGTVLPADAPRGLCPQCLIGAAFFETLPEEVSTDSLGDARPESQVAPVDLDGFKRAILTLGLIPTEEFNRFVAGALGGVPGLAKALVTAGKLTAYQVAALSQGKARWLALGNYLILDKLGAGGMGGCLQGPTSPARSGRGAEDLAAFAGARQEPAPPVPPRGRCRR
jgi:hypothetical protein